MGGVVIFYPFKPSLFSVILKTMDYRNGERRCPDADFAD